MSERKPYPSDVSDREWRILEPLLPRPCKRGRPLKHDRREILNAIFYLLRSSCAWRMLSHDFPSYKIVSHYFYAWRDDGTWQKVHDALRGKVQYESRVLGRITLSLGVASFPQHRSSAQSLLQAADSALYEAKHGGRDRATGAPAI